MRTIAKREKKDRGIRNEGTAQDTGNMDWGKVDAKVALIQSLIPLGLKAVAEALEEEVVALVGQRYQRGGRPPGYARWSAQRANVEVPLHPRASKRGCYAVSWWV